MNYKLKNKKAEISMETFFFILMMLLMIWIIYFGISKLFLVNDTISEQERIDIKNQLKKGFEYCDDPLNAGSFKTIEINSNMINGVCVFTNDINSGNNKLDNELNLVKKGGNNIALINGNNIIDSFKVESIKDFCSFREENKIFKIKINC